MLSLPMHLDTTIAYALHRTRLHVSITFAALYLLQHLKPASLLPIAPRATASSCPCSYSPGGVGNSTGVHGSRGGARTRGHRAGVCATSCTTGVRLRDRRAVRRG
ncbi:hypothetical protein OF83DRAFT_697294 [Amylostereum chailletii]|nr:hypothetical protein OF83DRAFT_697294 [Amylostereum chailletii]